MPKKFSKAKIHHVGNAKTYLGLNGRNFCLRMLWHGLVCDPRRVRPRQGLSLPTNSDFSFLMTKAYILQAHMSIVVCNMTFHLIVIFANVTVTVT